MEDEKSNEYTGPTSQAPTALNIVEKMSGVDAGCMACKRAMSPALSASTISTNYLTNDGVRHHHVYIAHFGVTDEGDRT